MGIDPNTGKFKAVRIPADRDRWIIVDVAGRVVMYGKVKQSHEMVIQFKVAPVESPCETGGPRPVFRIPRVIAAAAVMKQGEKLHNTEVSLEDNDPGLRVVWNLPRDRLA